MATTKSRLWWEAIMENKSGEHSTLAFSANRVNRDIASRKKVGQSSLSINMV